jgi:hypothetical protein
MSSHAQGHRTMEADPLTHSPSIEGKPKPAKARKGKPADRPIGKRSLNLSLPLDDYERLAVHALRLDTTISELVCKLAREHLREFHITRTPSRDAG